MVEVEIGSQGERGQTFPQRWKNRQWPHQAPRRRAGEANRHVSSWNRKGEKGAGQMKLGGARETVLSVCKKHLRGWALASSQGGQSKQGLIRVSAAFLACRGRAQVLNKPV